MTDGPGTGSRPDSTGPDSTGPDSDGYADWSQRALALLIDAAIVVCSVVIVLLVAVVIRIVSHALGDLVTIVGLLAVLALVVQNHVIAQGRTGQSLGKKQIGISVVAQPTGRPLGAGLTFVRSLAHIVDSVLLIGYLWPLWDVRKQTFADKLVHSVVVRT
jgi:uncharacterized RDD family membrane protein YckC